MPIAAGDVPVEALVVSHAALEVMVKLVGNVAAMEIVWLCGALSLGRKSKLTVDGVTVAVGRIVIAKVTGMFNGLFEALEEVTEIDAV